MRGFTLIELMIVIAIIAIIATFAALSAESWSRESRLGESRDRLVASLEELKIRAIAGVPFGVRISGGVSTQYVLQELQDANEDFVRDATEAITAIETVTLSTRFKVSINGGSEEIWFDRKGIPRTGTWGTMGRTITIWYDGNNNGAVDGGESRRLISISSNGRIQS